MPSHETRGRPRKTPDDLRSVFVRVRLTRAELLRVEEMADEANTSISGYLRDQALGAQHRPGLRSVDRADIYGLVQELQAYPEAGAVIEALLRLVR